MKERSLVAFTILSQLAVGAFWSWAAVGRVAGRPPVAGDGWTLPVLGAVLAVMLSGLTASFFHLGAPIGAWRACANLRSSWLSREILFASLFTTAAATLAVLCGLDAGPVTLRQGLAGLAALLGALLLLSMVQAYRLRTIPAWNTWATPVWFFGSALLLGSLGIGAALAAFPAAAPSLAPVWRRALILMALLLLGAPLLRFRSWARRPGAGPRAASGAWRQARLFRLQVALAAVGMGLLGMLLFVSSAGLAIAAFGVALGSEVVGRLLFYVARVESGW